MISLWRVTGGGDKGRTRWKTVTVCDSCSTPAGLAFLKINAVQQCITCITRSCIFFAGWSGEGVVQNAVLFLNTRWAWKAMSNVTGPWMKYDEMEVLLNKCNMFQQHLPACALSLSKLTVVLLRCVLFISASLKNMFQKKPGFTQEIQRSVCCYSLQWYGY